MIRTLLENIQHYFLKVNRLSSILFKRNKRIEKISFDYHKNWHFDNAYLIVDFEFKNAVWFRIGKFKSFDFSKPIILNLENIQTNTIYFEVFGLFQKQVYEINLNRETQINTQPFKTKIEKISKIKLAQQKSRVRMSKMALLFSNPTFVFEKIALEPQNFQIDYKPFKVQDYL